MMGITHRHTNQIYISEFNKTQLLCADVFTCPVHLLRYSNFSHDWHGLSIRFLTTNCFGILYVNNFDKFDQWINVERYSCCIALYILRHLRNFSAFRSNYNFRKTINKKSLRFLGNIAPTKAQVLFLGFLFI